jgi:hypothetical protein
MTRRVHLRPASVLEYNHELPETVAPTDRSCCTTTKQFVAVGHASSVALTPGLAGGSESSVSNEAPPSKVAVTPELLATRHVARDGQARTGNPAQAAGIGWAIFCHVAPPSLLRAKGPPAKGERCVAQRPTA